MFAKITESKLRAGGLPALREGEGGEDVGGVKLSFGKAIQKAPLPGVGGVRTGGGGVLGIGEEEEEAGRKRELITLDYSDEEDVEERKGGELGREKERNSRLNERDKERKREEVRKTVMGGVEECFKAKVKWGVLSEVRPFLSFFLFLFRYLPFAELSFFWGDD